MNDAAQGVLPARVKPLLRGVSHEIAFYVTLIAGPLLFAFAPAGRAAWAAVAYAVCLSALFGASALYHRPHWQPRARARMRRVDHAAIYLLIAGTYTPIAALAVSGAAGARLLWLAWGGAVLGIAKSLLWPQAPRALTAAIYVALGWLFVAEGGAVARGLGAAGLALLLGGGALYTAGAVIYARRCPDPAPRVFGYHEIFHALVVAAAMLHFGAVARLVISDGRGV